MIAFRVESTTIKPNAVATGEPTDGERTLLEFLGLLLAFALRNDVYVDDLRFAYASFAASIYIYLFQSCLDIDFPPAFWSLLLDERHVSG